MHRFLTACILAIPAISVLGTDSNANQPAPAEKDYHFFVGASLSISHEGDYFPIERIWNARAHIKVDDDTVVQRVRDIEEIKVDRQAKISPRFATISDLKCDPEYSVARDPRTQAARQQAAAQSMASQFSDEADSIYRDVANPNAFMQMPRIGLTKDGHMAKLEDVPDIGGTSAVSSSSDAATIVELQQIIQIESNLSISQAFDTASDLNDFDSSPTRPMWDMLHMQFSINSDQYIPSGHLVFVFQLADIPEGEPVMSWFHFLSVEDITPEEKSYNYRLSSYPDGMYIASQEVFLFTNGTEVATNLSSKLVDMSRDDARVFLKYQYIAQNSGKTRPPERGWKYLDSPLRERVIPGIRDHTIKLKIDPDGSVVDITTSREVRFALKANGIPELASLIYLPALENGKPVVGELSFKLDDVMLH